MNKPQPLISKNNTLPPPLLNPYIDCPICKGEGYTFDKECIYCQGTGQVRKEQLRRNFKKTLL
jgi:DnaJ-class molecular chaperone